MYRKQGSIHGGVNIFFFFIDTYFFPFHVALWRDKGGSILERECKGLFGKRENDGRWELEQL